jgi:sulfide dehydrogenase [flavocytochrome c] flavoprotein chain
MMQRRHLLQGTGSLGLLALAGCARDSGVMLTSTAGGAVPAKARVLVVGGGYGGATAAKYVRLFSGQKIDVVLVEPNDAFVSCPVSNLVLGGSKTMADITTPYTALARNHGVRVIKDMVASIDPVKKVAVLASGPTIAYDKLILSPGIDLMWDSIAGRPGRKRWRCGASSKPCPMAAPTPSPFPRRRTAARRGPTSAPARWPATSRRPSPAARC